MPGKASLGSWLEHCKVANADALVLKLQLCTQTGATIAVLPCRIARDALFQVQLLGQRMDEVAPLCSWS